jgi:hypothetical protein
MPTESDDPITASECIDIQPRDIMLMANNIHQESKFREVLNWDNEGLIIRCIDINLNRLRSTICVNYVDKDDNKVRAIIRDKTFDLIESIPYSTVATRFLMRVKHIVDTILNDAFRHKFKWRIVFIHPLPRQIRSHIAGGDVSRGEDQTIEPLDAVQM